MDQNYSETLAFLLQLFPDTDPAAVAAKISESSTLDQCIDLLLEQPEASFDNDLETLFSMFPDIDMNDLFEALLLHPEISKAVEHILQNNQEKQREDNVMTVLLPKSKTTGYYIHPKEDSGIRKKALSLHEALPQFSLETVEQFLKDCKGNVDECFTRLSALDPRNDVRAEIANELLQLEEILPNISKSRIASAYHSLRSVAKVLNHFVGDESAKHRKIEFSGIVESALSSAIVPIYPAPTRRKSEEAFTEVRSSKSFNDSKMKIENSDPEELRLIAQEHLANRNEMYHKAANAFQRGGLTGRGSAAYLSEEGRRISIQMELANERAAQAILARNVANHQGHPDVIDLHGLTAREAKAALEEYVSIRMGARRLTRFKVITGAGNHSMNRSVLYPAAYSFLRKLGLQLEAGGNGWFFCRVN